MARYTGPRVKKARRYGAPIFANAAVLRMRRQGPPGARPARRRKISDRGLQLIEKQKVRFAYGLMEKQFRRYYERAAARPGVTGDNLMASLERRLDNVVYRMGFGGTRAQARQLVTHGLIAVNGKKLDVPSAETSIDDRVSFSDRGKRSKYIDIVKEDIQGREVPGWIEVDRDALEGRVSGAPGTGDIEPYFNPSAIVEYYSR
ncbi:MAG: 30S ribosomal protein S4 [Chloroflexi bacterium]|nr:30S ribosomal protein S4 [Chloroflexota bacterium]